MILLSFANAKVFEFMLFDKSRHIIMSWTPKSACTKMIEMFWNQMGLYRGTFYPKNAVVHQYKTKFRKTYGHTSSEMIGDSHNYKFKVVRNP